MFWIANLTKIGAAVSLVTISALAGLKMNLQDGSVSDLQGLLPEVAIAVIFAGFMILTLRLVRQIYLDGMAARERQESAFLSALKAERDDRAEDNGRLEASLERLTEAFSEHEKHAAAAAQAVKESSASVNRLVAELESTRPG